MAYVSVDHTDLKLTWSKEEKFAYILVRRARWLAHRNGGLVLVPSLWSQTTLPGKSIVAHHCIFHLYSIEKCLFVIWRWGFIFYVPSMICCSLNLMCFCVNLNIWPNTVRRLKVQLLENNLYGPNSLQDLEDHTEMNFSDKLETVIFGKVVPIAQIRQTQERVYEDFEVDKLLLCEEVLSEVPHFPLAKMNFGHPKYNGETVQLLQNCRGTRESACG